ncbi:hypothetical protein AB0E62_39460 [Streptomyces sp. NPDC038707]|uniref:hypothetical protein n=1 Tax=Streptomyces sp. NPDC038707 TaxID=3154329 RepID=UPI0033F9ADF4
MPDSAAVFAALSIALFIAHSVGDHWVNAANSVSTFHRVSIWSRAWAASRARWRPRLSRLSNVSAASRIASAGVTVA